MNRGDLYWTNLWVARGPEPALRRPVLIIQSAAFTRTRIPTVIVAIVTSNLKYREFPGNVLVSKKGTKLTRDSVVNVSQIATVNKSDLTDPCGKLEPEQMRLVNEGLRLVLSLAS